MQERPVARARGLIIGRLPTGPHNAITDVAGVRVGHVTLSRGEGKKAIRTGVTAIIPNESWGYRRRIRAGLHVLNGAGEMTCFSQIREWGLLETPIVLTNTMSVGVCYHAVARHMTRRFPSIASTGNVVIPVVAECDDSFLNNAALFAIEEAHVVEALESAAGGPVAQGCVGAGTGMTAFDFKAGIGSASRRVPRGYTVGCLVLANFGRHHDLRIAGLDPEAVKEALRGLPIRPDVAGSLIAILATDAPLHPHELSRLAQRVGLGAARIGSNAYHGSGEIFLAFSTANSLPRTSNGPRRLLCVEEDELNPLFLAATECAEEAILNSLCAAHETLGRDGNRTVALPL